MAYVLHGKCATVIFEAFSRSTVCNVRAIVLLFYATFVAQDSGF